MLCEALLRSPHPASIKIRRIQGELRRVEDRGLEPVPSSLQKTPLLKQGNAQYNALSGDDERLRLLLEAWAELPESVKDAVLEMVRG